VRLLLDTNVLVAAFVARGVCSELLERCVRHHVVICSRPRLDELGEVLTRKFHQRVVDLRGAIRLLAETGDASVSRPRRRCCIGDGARRRMRGYCHR